MNGRCIALTVWDNLLSVICRSQFLLTLNAYMASIQTLQNIFLMAVMYRLIHNLEAAIKGKKRSFRNLGKIFTKYLYGGAHFHVKFKSEPCHLGIQNISHNRLYRKSCSLYFENLKDLFIYRVIKNSCFTFSKVFSNQ